MHLQMLPEYFIVVARFIPSIMWGVRGRCFLFSFCALQRSQTICNSPFAGSSTNFLCPHWGFNTLGWVQLGEGRDNCQGPNVVGFTCLWLLRTTWDRRVWNVISKIEKVWLRGFIFLKKKRGWKGNKGENWQGRNRGIMGCPGLRQDVGVEKLQGSQPISTQVFQISWPFLFISRTETPNPRCVHP